VCALAATGCGDEARAAREIPVGIYNVNNQVMNSGRYLYALRFVIDQDTTISRFISGFNLEGSDYLNALRRRGIVDLSRPGYAAGDGGMIRARLVPVAPDGRPRLRHVLAQETVSAARRYEQSRRAFRIARGTRTMLLYFDFGGVRVRGGVPYAVVYQNVHPRPNRHWFSEQSPTVRASEAGPNGRNTLNRRARGAIAGLDPREAVAWSSDGGRSWVWGRRVGEGHTPGAYAGSSTGDDGARLPWYGWQAVGGEPQSNQPYYAYRQSGNYRVLVGPARRLQVLRRAGGYAELGTQVGVVTVRNLATGAVARTRRLGSGIAVGELTAPLPVAAGETYEISHTGRVLREEGDDFIRRTFGAPTLEGGGRVRTLGAPGDRAQLFALP
jgi:hypothetical protein